MGLSRLIDGLEDPVGAPLVRSGKYPVELRFYLESIGGRKPASHWLQTERRLRPLARRALRT